MRLGAVLAMCAPLLACQGGPTEALIQVDADGALRAGGHRLCMRVRDATGSSLDGEVCLDDGEFTWPATLPVHRRPSSTREEFLFEAELLDGSSRVAVARARVRFRPGQTGELRLTLSAACAGACGDGTTCVMGACEPACFELSAPGAGASPSLPVECWTATDAGVADGGLDASSDAGPDSSDGGRCMGISDGDGGCRCATGRWWELDFDADPTSLDTNGDGLPDWRTRSGRSFPASELGGGVWRTTGLNLDTNPDHDFDVPTSVHLRFRSTSTSVDGGAVFWLNADASATGFGAVHADLSLQASGLQELALYGRTGSIAGGTRDVEMVRLAELPDALVDLWLLLVPSTNDVTIWLQGMNQGSYSYADIEGDSGNPAATLLGAGGGEAVFDYVRIESCSDGVMTPDGVVRP